MNQKTSPLINVLESRYGATGQLATLGYESVFDVSRVTREQFIREHRERISVQSAGVLYDQALGYAQHVAFRFRQRRLTRLVQQTLGPFTVPGPSYDEQFQANWRQMSAVDAIEANTSPAAYLVSLYNLAIKQENDNASAPGNNAIHPLAQRRPDIPKLVVDNDSLNQRLPALTVVNQILSSAIEPTLPTGKTVDEILAATYYPNTLPYHFAYQQTTEGFAVSGTSLADVIQQVDTAWPYFIKPITGTDTPARKHAIQLASPLAPPLQALLKAQPYFSTHMLTLAQLTAQWGSGDYSTTEMTPWQGLIAHAYVTPSQDSVVDAPTKLIWSSEDVAAKITLKTSGGQTVLVRGKRKEYWDRSINNAIMTDGAPYQRYPKLQFIDADNDELDLKKDPLRADFFIRMQQYYDNKNYYTDISFTLILDGNEHPEIYTTTQTSFYQSQFGINPDLIVGDYPTYFSTVKLLTERTGLTVSQLENMLCARVGGDTVVLSPNIVVRNTIFTNGHTDQTPHMPYHYGAVYLHAGKKPAIAMTQDDDGNLTLTGLTDDRLDRLNRLVRVQRAMQLPFDQLDQLMTAGMRAEGADPRKADGNLGLYANANTIRLLGIFCHYRQHYGATAEQFAALVHQITPYAITPNVPLLDRLFNSQRLFDEPYTLDWENVDYTATATTPNKGRDARIAKQLAAGLKLTDAEFALLAGLVAQHQGNITEHTFPNSLDAVSALYRLTTLARWLDMSIASALALIRLLDNAKMLGDDRPLLAQLAGVPSIAVLNENGEGKTHDVLDGLMLLSNAVHWLQAQNLTVEQCVAWLLPVPLHIGNQRQLDFIRQLSESVARTLVTPTHYDHSGASSVDTEGKPIDWGVLMTEKELVNAQGLVMDNADTATQTQIEAAVRVVVDQQKLDAAEKAQATAALSALIYNAQQSQRGILSSTLAQLLAQPQAVVSSLVRWAGSTPCALLQHTLALSELSSAQQIPADYLALLAMLTRGAQLSTCFQLSAAMLDAYLAHPAWFGGTTPTLTALDFATLYRLGCYRDWLHQTSQTENDLLAYLSWVNGEKPPPADEAAQSLAGLLGWQANEVQAAAAYVTGSEETPAHAVPQIATILRLYHLSQQTGLAVASLVATVSIGPESDYASWQQLGQAVAAASEQQITSVH